MSTTGTEPLHRVAWSTYPSLHGPWKPSKIHYSTEPWGDVLCGARKGRAARYSKPYDMRDHERDAGRCARCTVAAKKRGLELPREDGR